MCHSHPVALVSKSQDRPTAESNHRHHCRALGLRQSTRRHSVRILKDIGLLSQHRHQRRGESEQGWLLAAAGPKARECGETRNEHLDAFGDWREREKATSFCHPLPRERPNPQEHACNFGLDRSLSRKVSFQTGGGERDQRASLLGDFLRMFTVVGGVLSSFEFDMLT